jgi:hypothetical protein
MKRAGSIASTRLASSGTGAPLTIAASTRAQSVDQVIPREPSAVATKRPEVRGTMRTWSRR